MSAAAIALVGTDKDRLGVQWASSLVAAGLNARMVWLPEATADAATSGAVALATKLGVQFHTGGLPDEGMGGLLIATRGPARAHALRVAGERGIPVLLDAPAWDPTARLEELLAPRSSTVMGAAPLTHHPGFTRVLSAVRNAEIGLLRAVALDLVTTVVPTEDGSMPGPVDVLRDFGSQGIELLRSLTGPASIRLQARCSPSGSWTLLGQTERDVVVSLHVSLVPSCEERPLLASARVVGTHGGATVDLSRPALQLRTSKGDASLAYGDSGVQGMLRQAAAVFRGERGPEPSVGIVAAARALDLIEKSAAIGRETEVTW